VLAEGEELGSNLLHVGQRSPAYPSEAERMAERAEPGSNILSHDLARVGTIPAYQKFWHVDGPQFLPAQRDAAAGEKSGSNVGYSALGSARDVPRGVWRYVRL
jgi:hypothetical protein